MILGSWWSKDNPWGITVQSVNRFLWAWFFFPYRSLFTHHLYKILKKYRKHDRVSYLNSFSFLFHYFIYSPSTTYAPLYPLPSLFLPLLPSCLYSAGAHGISLLASKAVWHLTQQDPVFTHLDCSLSWVLQNKYFGKASAEDFSCCLDQSYGKYKVLFTTNYFEDYSLSYSMAFGDREWRGY